MNQLEHKGPVNAALNPGVKITPQQQVLQANNLPQLQPLNVATAW